MGDRQKMEPEVRTVLEKLKRGEIDNEMYKTVYEDAKVFLQMGITPYALKELLEQQAKVAFLPDAFSFSLQNPGRGEYLLEKFDNPSVRLVNDNEKRFVDALKVYYQQAAEYKQKLESLSGIAAKYLKQENMSSYYTLGEKQELEFLKDILMDKDSDIYLYGTRNDNKHFLKKFDLYEAYFINDDKLTLKWKAGEALESEGILEKGITERKLKEAGVSVDKLCDNVLRFKVDRLRVHALEMFCMTLGGKDCVRYLVDGVEQPTIQLSADNSDLLYWMGDAEGIGVKIFAGILDENRENGLMIMDEKALARIGMPYADRLVDIYRHGMTKQDVMLSKDSLNLNLDRFWEDIMVTGMEKQPIETQKRWAFERLVDQIGDIRPGMLTDEEIILLVGIYPDVSGEGREVEKNLMELPEVFFPLVEKSGEFDCDVIDYVKVQRNIGRITPSMAYNSMCYFLSLRYCTVWDPEGADDEYGRVVGGSFYPYEDMKNPAKNFPPNLLSEEIWNLLGNKYNDKTAEFIPQGAFRENRITDVQVYPQCGGELNIRCKVDGEQQSGKQLAEEDALRYKDVKTNLKEMAVGYFMDAFAREPERGLAQGR